jgi:anti-sigma-K factor RskA
MKMEQDTHPTDLLAAYALGVLDLAELDQVKTHLESCRVCQEELAAQEAVTNMLSISVPQAEPPEGLRQRLMAEVRRPLVTAETAVEGRWWQQVGQSLRRFMAVPGRRPAAVILILVISNVLLFVRLQQIESQLLANEQTITLSGTDTAPEADGIMLIREGDSTGTLLVNGLPDLGPEQQYQLWLVKDEIRLSGAVFSATEEGFTLVQVTAPEPLVAYSRFGITIEPTGGSPGPTGPGVLRSSSPETSN